MLYPWQHADWQRLGPLFERWPHALLILGAAGTGRAEFGRHLAQRLLCEAPDAQARPCGHCVACHWFAQGNHPDFRAVLPAALAATLGTAPGAVEASEESAGAAPADSEGGASGKARALSKDIRIEQVRALFDFCTIGSHRGGRRVVLLYPAEALNGPAANALLKLLEEPPEGVAFILLGERADRLLPTIVSRCRQWPMQRPDVTIAARWLREQGADDAPALLAEAGGAPLGALALANDTQRDSKRWLLEQLAAGAQCDAFSCGEQLQKVPIPALLGWLQRWLSDLVLVRMAQRTRYYPAAEAALQRCASALDSGGLQRLLGFARAVERARATEGHPLAARLVIESLLLQYRGVFKG